MRLAVCIAAWSHDPDATVPPEHVRLPSALEALGFTVVQAHAGSLAERLGAALAGAESTDTVLVHLSGVLAHDGSLEVGAEDVVPLGLVADALAARPTARSLVFVEAAYRGPEDSMRAVEQVEAVADALSSNAGSHTTVVAVHPESSDVAKLAFTHAVLEAARHVVQADGSVAIHDAYTRARERHVSGVAASGFAFLKGGVPFTLALGLPPSPVSSVSSVSSVAPSSQAASLGSAPPSFPESSAALTQPQLPSSPLSSPASSAAISVMGFLPPDSSTGSVPSVPTPTSSVPAATLPLPPPPRRTPSWPLTPPPPHVAQVTNTSLGETQASPIARGMNVPPRESSASEWVELSEPALESPTLEQLDARIEEASARGDHRLGVKRARLRLAHLTSVEARVDELFEIGRTLVAKLRDLPEAVVTLEEARAIDPTRTDVLEALRRSYARLERWTEAFAVSLALVKCVTDPHERAGLRVAAGLLASEHLDDEDYAIDLFTEALQDDPHNEAALDELVRIRRARGDLVDLEHLLTLLANRLVESGDAARAWDACQKLAALRRDDLGDAAGAVEALAIAKRLPLTELDSRAVLAEQLIALDDHEGAIAELEAIVTAEPGHVRAHARLFSVHHHDKNLDRAYLQALVLEELGDADATARELLEAYRADWGLRARSALDDAAWQRLRAPGSDEAIEAIFRTVTPAAIAALYEDRGARPALDPARRQPPTSTASIVRCFHWAARALATPAPALYVLDEVEGGIAAVPAPEPTTALGPAVLKGLSSKTLAFLAARHLTYFRPEYQVLVHFPTVEAAATLFFAAVDLVTPGTVIPPNLAGRVESMKINLARRLRPDDLMALSDAVGRLESRDEGIDLLAWIRSVELAAGRAGLLLAGDLQTALGQVRLEERGLSGLGQDARRADLLSFCASRALAELRASYVDLAPSSMRPPLSDAPPSMGTPPSGSPLSVRGVTTQSGVVRMDDLRLGESGERVTSSRRMA
jgi:tetratricopeptide (TPR) repeat protein